MFPPGIDTVALAAFFAQAKGSLLGLFDMFAGGALSNLSVFALGIMPYISASIILQLLTVAIPYLEKLSKEGEAGRRKITQYTRYGTVVLSLIQGFRNFHRSGKHGGPHGSVDRDQYRLGIPSDDGDHLDCRYGIYHVAG